MYRKWDMKRSLEYSKPLLVYHYLLTAIQKILCYALHQPYYSTFLMLKSREYYVNSAENSNKST